MAIFNQPATAKKESVPFPSDPMPAPAKESTPINDYAAPQPAAARWTEPRTEAKESLIASDITIEGKIEGTGHVRIAGKFKGDVNVQGDLTIEAGAKLTGSVRAEKVTVAGELEGNVEGAAQINVLATGAVIGDVKAGAVTVASGARMRGQVNFGWDDSKPAKTKNGFGSEATN
jgi:cytoskeletal protein CcmA (bactofilin family)